MNGQVWPKVQNQEKPCGSSPSVSPPYRKGSCPGTLHRQGTMGHLTLRSKEGWQQEGAGRLRVPGAPRRQNLSRNFPGLVPAAVSAFSLSQMAVPGFRGICCLLITEETSRKQQKLLR